MTNPGLQFQKKSIVDFNVCFMISIFSTTDHLLVLCKFVLNMSKYKSKEYSQTLNMFERGLSPQVFFLKHDMSPRC